MSKSARLLQLTTLLSRRSHIQISDYLEAIDHCISRQQALSDLKQVSSILQKGQGRSAYWVRAKICLRQRR